MGVFIRILPISSYSQMINAVGPLSSIRGVTAIIYLPKQTKKQKKQHFFLQE